ncbi:MAG: hypothetical protein HN576_04170 [Bacteriovoracaceae bacterium]|jgi:hypothetical protein|nr:hypothetical protein [Bacteriovoracaceae bacterium]
MKNLVWISFISALFFLSTPAFSDESKNIRAKLENYLLTHDWPGRDVFLKEGANGKVNVCELIENISKKYPKKRYTQRRIMIILENSKCAYKLKLAHQGINSKRPLMIAQSVNLISTFSKKDKADYLSKIKSLKKSNTDVAVVKALKNFGQDKK